MSEEKVIGCHSVAAWTEHLEKSHVGKKLIVVDFTATWCGPCRFIAPIFAELARKNPEVTFLKVDVDELKTVSEEWGVEAMPTFLFLKEGKVIDKIVGAKKDELLLKVAKHATADEPATAGDPTTAGAKKEELQLKVAKHATADEPATAGDPTTASA